jgi:hypothetical protein
MDIRKLFLKKIWLLILSCFVLSACGFPIHSRYSDMPGTNLISGSFRVIASVVQYSILFGILATIPLYIKKFFENPMSYGYYKVFWWVASIVFANIGLLLFDVEPTIQNQGYWFFMICLIVIILIPTLLPAAYQFHKNKN